MTAQSQEFWSLESERDPTHAIDIATEADRFSTREEAERVAKQRGLKFIAHYHYDGENWIRRPYTVRE